MSIKKVGIVGFGHLALKGKYLYDKLVKDPNFEIAFVWNRSPIQDSDLSPELIIQNLEDFLKSPTDLIIEVAHPIISDQWGEKFLEHSDYVIGSPTALADENVLKRLENAAAKFNRKIYVPCGAFWGANDIKKMSERNTLVDLKVTMKKHPDSLKLEGSLKQILEGSLPLSNPITLYNGCVKDICKLAPNNVNTMAVAALSALNLGFDKVKACLIADPSLTDRHIIEIEVTGPYNSKLDQHFKSVTVRSNPAIVGHVTGNQTYESFYYSLLGRGIIWHAIDIFLVLLTILVYLCIIFMIAIDQARVVFL